MNILIQISLILVFTKIFGILSRRAHLPQVAGALLAGIILGPALFNVVDQSEMIYTLAEIGVILLMFSAGLETDLKQLRKALKSSLIIAVLGAVLPLAGGFALAYVFGSEIMQSVFIGLVLTATSISITVETLREMGKLKTNTGTTIMGAAVIDDVLGVIILSFVIGMGSGGGAGGGNFLAFGGFFLKIIGFFALAWVLGNVVFKLIDHLAGKYVNARRLSIFSLAFCFALAYLAGELGIADITGAYFAGLALCSSKAERFVEEQSGVLSYLFFSPIFFVSVGLYASFDGLSADILLFAFLLLLVAIVTKMAGCALGARICKFTKVESVQIGTGMVSRGEVAIVIATKGIVAGLLSAEFFSVVIVVIIVTTLITPLLLKLVYSKKMEDLTRPASP
ncbi:MAG: cation:proton antiporter [Oscillospiraceae bacterium]|nr:cation:proton antiporter [Oscillospiraceae bacterium]